MLRVFLRKVGRRGRSAMIAPDETIPLSDCWAGSAWVLAAGTAGGSGTAEVQQNRRRVATTGPGSVERGGEVVGRDRGSGMVQGEGVNPTSRSEDRIYASQSSTTSPPESCGCHRLSTSEREVGPAATRWIQTRGDPGGSSPRQSVGTSRFDVRGVAKRQRRGRFSSPPPKRAISSPRHLLDPRADDAVEPRVGRGGAAGRLGTT